MGPLALFSEGNQLARILLTGRCANCLSWAIKGVIEMRRALTLTIAGLFVLLVSAAQAQAQTITFNAALHGGGEVPTPIITGAVGTAVVTWNTATKAGTYRVEVYNLPSGAVASHIHVGASNVAGPVIINFTVPQGISNDFALTGTFACSDVQPRQPQGVNSCEDFEQALLLNNTYVNVHSQVNGGGEIRGQLVRQ